jgi:hypothetical protein
MHFPRLPHWLVYLSIVLALLFAALGRRERINAPPAPPPLPAAEGAVLSNALPFDPASVVKVTPDPTSAPGVAFSVNDGGVWLTARSLMENCRKAAVMVDPTDGLEAKVWLDPNSEIAVLTTAGGAPALPLAPVKAPDAGTLAFDPGFPKGRPGEVAVRLLGSRNLFLRERQIRTAPALVWADVGRTVGLGGSLMGLIGAPVLDSEGRVIGVTLSEAPRRGRIYSTTPQSLQQSLAASGAKPSPQAAGAPITAANYGRAADDLRRDYRVATVVCLKR